MRDLSKFNKMGVRVPQSLKRRVRRLAVDLDAEGVKFSGGEVTMEAIMAVAALEVLAMGDQARAEMFRRRLPELIGLFEAEMPPEGEAPPAGGPGGGLWAPVEMEGAILPTKKKGRPKRSGNGGEGA